MFKDVVESILATTIILAYVWLVVAGKASVDGFGAIAMYVVKKYLDGVEDERKKKGGKDVSEDKNGTSASI